MSTTLSDSAIAGYAYRAGFRGSALTTTVAVALAESGGDPHCRGDVSLQTSTWGPSMGLWQIRSLNAQHGTGGQRDAVANTHPADNARHAFQISSGGHNWQPWSTYTNGAYRSYLTRAAAAAKHAGTSAPKPGSTGKSGGGGYRVVLDVAELNRLGELCDTSRMRVEHSNRVIQDVATDLAAVSRSDQGGAWNFAPLLSAVTDPGDGLPLLARNIDRDARLAHQTHDLAKAADGGDGRYTHADLVRFLRQAHGKTDRIPAAAVIEALRHNGFRTAHRAAPKHTTPGPAHAKLPPVKKEKTGDIIPAALAHYRNGRLPAGTLASIGDGRSLWSGAAKQFRRMDQAAHAAGIDLHANSGYRSYADQARLYQLYLSGRGNLAAQPGQSNHGWGLSADIQTAGSPKTLAWLRANAARYGFFNDVPSENWHWTYRPA